MNKVSIHKFKVSSTKSKDTRPCNGAYFTFLVGDFFDGSNRLFPLIENESTHYPRPALPCPTTGKQGKSQQTNSESGHEVLRDSCVLPYTKCFVYMSSDENRQPLT